MKKKLKIILGIGLLITIIIVAFAIASPQISSWIKQGNTPSDKDKDKDKFVYDDPKFNGLDLTGFEKVDDTKYCTTNGSYCYYYDAVKPKTLSREEKSLALVKAQKEIEEENFFENPDKYFQDFLPLKEVDFDIENATINSFLDYFFETLNQKIAAKDENYFSRSGTIVNGYIVGLGEVNGKAYYDCHGNTYAGMPLFELTISNKYAFRYFSKSTKTMQLEQAFVANDDLVKVNLGQLYPNVVGNSIYDKDMSFDVTTPITYGDYIEGERYFPIKTYQSFLKTNYESLDAICLEKGYDSIEIIENYSAGLHLPTNRNLYYKLKCGKLTLAITDFCTYWEYGNTIHIFGEGANLVYCNPNEKTGNTLYDVYNHSFFGKYNRTVTQNFTKRSSWENKDKDFITYIDNFDKQVDTNPYEYGISIGNYVEVYDKETDKYVPDGKGTSFTAIFDGVSIWYGDMEVDLSYPKDFVEDYVPKKATKN